MEILILKASYFSKVSSLKSNLKINGNIIKRCRRDRLKDVIPQPVVLEKK